MTRPNSTRYSGYFLRAFCTTSLAKYKKDSFCADGTDKPKEGGKAGGKKKRGKKKKKNKQREAQDEERVGEERRRRRRRKRRECLKKRKATVSNPNNWKETKRDRCRLTGQELARPGVDHGAGVAVVV